MLLPIRLVASGVLVFAGLACATPQPPTAAASKPVPCGGHDIDFDVVTEVCAARADVGPMPAQLKTSLTPERPTVRAGEAVGLILELTNMTRETLSLDVPIGCDFFTVKAPGIAPMYGDGCSDQTACALGFAVHVELEPGGTLRKRIPFSVTRLHVDPQPNTARCRKHWEADVLPGVYRLEVTLPFMQLGSTRPEQPRYRTVETSVTVVVE